jgi:hypothetical protein
MLLKIMILAVASVTALNLIDEDPLLDSELIGEGDEMTNLNRVNMVGDYRTKKVAEREAKRAERQQKKFDKKADRQGEFFDSLPDIPISVEPTLEFTVPREE